jgi:predicted RNase H-like HicB family nuclease
MTIMSTLHLTARIWPEDGAYVALCPELGVASEGDSYEHARDMLRDALTGYIAVVGFDAVAAQLHPDAAQFDISISDEDVTAA